MNRYENPYGSTHLNEPESRPLHAVMAAVMSILICAGIAVTAHADDGSAVQQTIDSGQRQGTGQVVLEQGHIDFGPTLNTGSWKMEIHDDTGDVSYWRMPQDVVMHLTSASILDMPEGDAYGFIGEPAGTPLWVVPQTQNPEVPWVGWNTQEPGVLDQLVGGMTLSLEGVDGPGDLDVYLENGNFSAPSVVWTTKKAYPQDSWIEANAHTHVNWVFHREGVYKVRLTLKGELKDGRQVSDTNTLRFAVGDGVDPRSAFDGEAVDDRSGEPSQRMGGDSTDDHSTGGNSTDTERRHAADARPERGDQSHRLAMLVGAAGGVVALGIVAIAVSTAIRSRRDRAEAMRAATMRTEEMRTEAMRTATMNTEAMRTGAGNAADLHDGAMNHPHAADGSAATDDGDDFGDGGGTSHTGNIGDPDTDTHIERNSGA